MNSFKRHTIPLNSLLFSMQGSLGKQRNDCEAVGRIPQLEEGLRKFRKDSADLEMAAQAQEGFRKLEE